MSSTEDVTETTANSPNSTSLRLSGTLSAALIAGEVVKVYDGATWLGDASAVAQSWDFVTASTAAGSHTFGVAVTNLSGTGPASSATVIAGTVGNDNALPGASAGAYVFGFAGNDTVNGFASADTVNGGAGSDTIALTATSAELNGATDAQIRNIESVSAARASAGVAIDLSNQTEAFAITGSSNADTITGSAVNDVINAGAGNDIVRGFVGSDSVDGGRGTDTLALAGTSSDLNAASDAQIQNVEVVSAAAAPTAVMVDLSNQSEEFFAITGSSNDDEITGGSGSDTIAGGAGADTLRGWLGNDVFDYRGLSNWAANGMDSVFDFAGNTRTIKNSNNLNISGDVLLFSEADLVGLGGFLRGTFVDPGNNRFSNLGTGDLVNGTAATAARAQFLYDPSTGVLSFDPDGTGGAPAVEVTTIGVDSHPASLAVYSIVIGG